MIQLVRDNTHPKLPTIFGEARGRPSEELTKATIARLAKEPPTGRDIYVRDSEQTGLKLRRDRKGRITFMYVGRVRSKTPGERGRLLNTTIGPARGKDAISLAKARVEALRLHEMARDGVHAVEEQRTRKRAAEVVTQQLKADRQQQNLHAKWTLAYSLEQMLAWRAGQLDERSRFRPKTEAYYREALTNVGTLAQMPVTLISAKEVRQALDSLPSIALRAKARRAVSALIGYAYRELDLDRVNPVSRLKRGEYRAADPRRSHIPKGKLGAWIDAVIETTNDRDRRLGMTAGNYALTLLLYGLRAQEGACMEWAWIEEDAETWTIPAEIAKTKRARPLPITPWMQRILAEQKRLGNPRWVFPGRDRRKHITDVRDAITKATGVPFRPHDLRRTFATHFAVEVSGGQRLKAIMGHADRDITESYTQAQIEKMREDLLAYQVWLWDLAYWRYTERTDPEMVQKIEEQARRDADDGTVWPVNRLSHSTGSGTSP